MSRSLASLSILLVVSLSATQASAQTDDLLAAELAVPHGLRVADVVHAAVGSSHERAARVREVEAARADVDRAWLQLVPRVALSGSYTRLSEITAPSLGYLVAPVDQSQGGVVGPTTTLVSVPISFPVILDQTQFRAQLAIPLTDYFVRVLPARDAAERVVDASAATLEATEARLALDAETVYWGWVRVRLAGRVAEQARAQASAHLDDARRLREAGVGIEADVARAEAQLAAMEELVLTTAHLESAVTDRLRTILHGEATPDAIGEALPDHALETGALEDDVARATAQRAELTAVDAQIAALEAQRLLTDAPLVPRVDLVGEVLVANPNPRFVPQQERFDPTWAVGAQVSFQLVDALSVDPARRALEARIASARESRALLTEGIRAEVVDARRQLADAETALASRTARIASAERTLRLASEIFREGRGTGLAVIDAETLLVSTRLSLLEARIDLALASARFRRATQD
jgi:outer membrane protein